MSAASGPLVGRVPGDVDEGASTSGGVSEGDVRPGHTEEQQRLLFSGMLAEEYYETHGVSHSSSFITNERGMKLFSHVWSPAKTEPRALICSCHGFGNDTNWMFQLSMVRLASAGYVVCALDYEGHGRSEGVRAGFTSVEPLVRDCVMFFHSVHQRQHLLSLPLFLMGESLGGAISLLIVHRTGKEYRGEGALSNTEGLPVMPWQGVVLLSPMLRIKEEMKPHWLIVLTLRHLAYVFPHAAIVPTPDTIVQSCRDPERLKLAISNPNRYVGKPRLGAAVECLRVTEEMSELMGALVVPFLVVHGEADLVTECFSSKELFKCALSKDKTLKLYPGGGHQLLQGESEGLREQVWGDILHWLAQRSSPSSHTH